jgi:uncharacterized RDD family membrane protein YckC
MERVSGGHRDTLRVSTSDNVGIGYDVAGLGSRLIAQILDTLIVGLVILAVSIGLIGILGAGTPQDATLGALAVAGIALFVYVGYFAACEMVSGGRTPGKAAGHLQVLDITGAAATPGQLFVRNFARVIDVILGAGAVVMFCSRHSRRIGDFLAGTVVVRVQPIASFPTVVVPPLVILRTPDAGPVIDGVGRLGDRELAVIRTFLSRPGLAPPLRARLAAAMTTRLLDRMQVPATAPERQWPPELFLERLYLQLQGRALT